MSAEVLTHRQLDRDGAIFTPQHVEVKLLFSVRRLVTDVLEPPCAAQTSNDSIYFLLSPLSSAKVWRPLTSAEP